ncbi:MAG TPA: response regulator, partial [Polyangiales bacterium]|nr:response regulator [Polyangiales bacterium]
TTQKSQVEGKNREIELAKQELEEKAEQLALTSKYKSEFLANMSHELRTPLNSLLILSRQLSEDRGKNLTDKQLEFARTIHQSGADLLALINEILDLAKIESGTMSVDLQQVALTDLIDYVDRSFRHVAQDRSLTFEVTTAARVPSHIETDEMRLRQVLRNMLSNALKFTERGSVQLAISSPEKAEWSVDNETLNSARQVIAFAVADTGIGIPKDKQKIIFESFQQADGGTSRKYGGTGLGLAISREIAGLLGGELRVQSEPGRGSTFTLYLPDRFVGRNGGRNPSEPSPLALGSGSMPTASPMQARAEGGKSTAMPASGGFSDDRTAITTGDRVLLIIEDDETFARILLGLVREHGFRGVVAKSGALGLELARTLTPDAITLDLRLPDMDGFVVLDQLKHNPLTRHIPVHVISAADEAARGLVGGAIAFLQKPVQAEALEDAMLNIENFLDRRVKHLLIVEDDETQRNAIMELIGEEDLVISAVASGEEALEKLGEQQFDCMVLDLKLPGMSGVELINAIKQNPSWRRTPVIVYTGKELSSEEHSALRRVTDTIIVKDVRSPERLLDETALFLHRVEAKLPNSKQQILRDLSQSDPALRGKHVLVADDDARNLFAITTILEQHEMVVAYAENGQQALDHLASGATVDIVLMDIMMPEMDGYEAMRRIRLQPEHAKLPIVALTAKAMQGDRDKCIQAGASDYITKPVDPDQLVSLLRVWLYR